MPHSGQSRLGVRPRPVNDNHARHRPVIRVQVGAFAGHVVTSVALAGGDADGADYANPGVMRQPLPTLRLDDRSRL
jgi:hypothetical protein